MLPVRRSFAMQNESIIHFIQPPSSLRGVPLVLWNTPRLGFEPVGKFAKGPNQDLLALAKRHATWVSPLALPGLCSGTNLWGRSNMLAVRVFDMYGRQYPRSDFQCPLLLLEKLLLTPWYLHQVGADNNRSAQRRSPGCCRS